MRPPTETRVQAVLTALVTGLAIEGVKILDGPENNTTDLRDLLGIGVGDEAVSVRQEKLPGYGDGYKETASVICGVVSWTGAEDEQGFAGRRARVTEILGAVREYLAANPTLGGACNRAILGGYQSWGQDLEDGGLAVKVGFSIDAETLT